MAGLQAVANEELAVADIEAGGTGILGKALMALGAGDLGLVSGAALAITAGVLAAQFGPSSQQSQAAVAAGAVFNGRGYSRPLTSAAMHGTDNYLGYGYRPSGFGIVKKPTVTTTHKFKVVK